MNITTRVKGIISMGILCALFGCSGIEPKKYIEQQPQADIKEFFNGPIKAWGIIQDRSGNVVSKFDVDMVGKWEDNKGVLEEDFHYYDGWCSCLHWRCVCIRTLTERR